MNNGTIADHIGTSLPPSDYCPQYRPSSVTYSERTSGAVDINPDAPNLFRLPCGRRLSYSEYGDNAGFPILYFHDCGSSRIECSFFHDSALALGYRLLAIDRPGIGYSDFHRYNCASDFCGDVLQLTRHLQLEKFALMSLGGGGVFALSMAHKAPNNVTCHLNLSGVPMSAFQESVTDSYGANFLSEIAPPLVKLVLRLKHRFFPDNASSHIAHLSSLLCYTDRKALNNPKVIDTLGQDLRESMRQGCAGVAQDVSLAFRKLDFQLHEINVPVLIWQGESDNLSGLSESEFMLRRIPHARLHRVPSRGRFFFLQVMDSVFGQISGVPARRAVAQTFPDIHPEPSLAH